MESNWRYNVYRYGLSYISLLGFWAQVRLCARILSGPHAGKLVARRFNNGIYARYVWSGDILGWQHEGDFLIPAAHPRFPFGFDVEPD